MPNRHPYSLSCGHLPVLQEVPHIAPLTFYKYSGLMQASAPTHDYLMSLRKNGRTLCAPTKKANQKVRLNYALEKQSCYKCRRRSRKCYHDKRHFQKCQYQRYCRTCNRCPYIMGGVEYGRYGHCAQHRIGYVVKKAPEKSGLYLLSEKGERYHAYQIGNACHYRYVYH